MTWTRPTLNLFGIPFGIAGLAGTWTAVAAAGLAPVGPADTLWVIATCIWTLLLLRYLTGSGAPAIGLAHPVLGPFAALFPATGLLLAGRLLELDEEVGQGGVIAMSLLAALFATWFLAHLLRGGNDIDAVHSGYLLPTTAATLLAAQTSAAAGWPGVARAWLSVGLLSWLLIGALLVARLAFRPPLPDTLVPTFAIFSAPPAVAGNAWFALHPADTGAAQQMLLGTCVLLLGVQVLTVPRYLKLQFTHGWWALTFTTAASATYVIHWSAVTAFTGWQAVSWTAVAIATLIIGAIAVRSVALAAASRRPAQHQTLAATPNPGP